MSLLFYLFPVLIYKQIFHEKNSKIEKNYVKKCKNWSCNKTRLADILIQGNCQKTSLSRPCLCIIQVCMLMLLCSMWYLKLVDLFKTCVDCFCYMLKQDINQSHARRRGCDQFTFIISSEGKRYFNYNTLFIPWLWFLYILIWKHFEIVHFSKVWNKGQKVPSILCSVVICLGCNIM